ncbi:MAG TPA: endonuclease Q family protein [Nitrososphaerales archaeon]|nr:endonuclease Q family protein [Nitrososphaerales archaeon]
MRVVADLQLHSKHAIATSKDMDLEHMAAGAALKGLQLLGTGDFTHPEWFAELKAKLEPAEGEGLFTYHGMTWMLAGEVSTVYQQEGKTRKVHHLLYSPDFESVSQINDRLSRFGDLSSDGRPVLKGMDSAELVELVTSVSSSVNVIPAHAWTPWFGVFGSKSGFDSLKECYQDQVGKIFTIETGLSSDPPMNWRLSSLDGVSLVSNSDAHSPNPWRLGREANVFDIDKPTYRAVFDAIRLRDESRFLYTIEVDPAYGKYHFTGHKKCGVSLPPSEARDLGNKCPRCGRKLTVGVLQRVEELADRPEGARPAGTIPYRRLLPLYEVVSFALGVNRLYARAVIEEQDKLIRAFGSELTVLLDAPEAEILKHTSSNVASAIMAVRGDRLAFQPGYDGVYGVPSLSEG